MKQSVSRVGLFSIAVCGVVIGGVAYFVAHSSGNANETQLGEADDWSQLNASMHKMHMAMAAIEESGNTDADFVRLMIPHHQGAIEMAKVQLLYGKDQQMRRLAQEIITDQQLEIELMQRWLKEHYSAQTKQNTQGTGAAERNR